MSAPNVATEMIALMEEYGRAVAVVRAALLAQHLEELGIDGRARTLLRGAVPEGRRIGDGVTAAARQAYDTVCACVAEMQAQSDERARHLRALREGVRGLAEMLGITDPNATVADVAAGIERLRVAARNDAATIGRLLTAGDKAAGEATLARHARDEALRQRDHLRRELDQVNLAAAEAAEAAEGARP